MSLRRIIEQRRDDAGISIVELLIAMAIFVTVIVVFMAGVVVMTKNTVRSQVTIDAGDDVRRVFQVMDKQVRYADAINRPGTGGAGRMYVEFRTPATVAASGVTTCTQWRWDPATELLQTRTWTDGPGTLPSFRTVATDIAAPDLTPAPTPAPTPTPTPYPFAMTPAEPTHPRQELSLTLRIEGAEDAEISTASTFIARNSSVESDGNADTNGDGVSDKPACWKTGVRP